MDGQRVIGGRYQLVDELGRGGAAVVWRAQDTVLGRPVAVKVLAGQHADDPSWRRRIRDEARAAATLSHPNIAHVYDYGESHADGICQPYVVMELVRGGTLQQRLQAGPLPPRAALRVGAEVAAALAAAHAEGLVHRDIKQANVMVTAAGAKVVDFGVAAAISPSRAGVRAAEVFGTPAYLAPERLTDDAVEPASDVYSLGVLIYRLLSGRSPWRVDTTTEMLAAHMSVEPTPLTALPEVPEYVTELCHRCLSKDPTRRPTARDAAAILAQAAGLRVVEDEPALATPGPAVDEQPSLLIRRPPASGTAPETNAAVPAGSGPPGPDRSPARDPDPAGSAPRNRRKPLLISVAALAVVAALLWQFTSGGMFGRRSTGTPPAVAAPPAAKSALPSVPAAGLVPGRPVVSTDAGPAGPTGGGETPGAPAHPSTPRPEPSTANPRQPQSPTPTTRPPALHKRNFSSSGGTVRAACTAPTTAQLLSWSATKPYKVSVVNAGPGRSPAITFRHGNRDVVMSFGCADGVPSAQIAES